MKYILLCLCITAHSALFGQPRLSVEYEMELKLEEVLANADPKILQKLASLDPKILQRLTNNLDVYDYQFFNNRSKYVFWELRKKDENLDSGSPKQSSTSTYKNFTDNVMYAQLDAEKDIVSMDSLATDQPWKIDHTSTKIILGFSCQKATKTVDGGEETVWFAPDIPISDGPGHYYGLPGLILQVENKVIVITASKMDTNDAAQWTIEMPEAEKYLSPEEFNKRTITKRN